MCGALQTEGHIRLTLMGHAAYKPRVGRVPSRGGPYIGYLCNQALAQGKVAEAAALVTWPPNPNRVTLSRLWCYAGILLVLPGSQSRRCPEARLRGQQIGRAHV